MKNTPLRLGQKLTRKLGLKAVRRITRDENGATAVEFSFIALPFFMLLFAIIETSLIFYASQIMETAVADTGRLIMTGQAQTTMNIQSAADFKKELCTRIAAVIDCTGGIHVDVKNYGKGTPNFNNASPVQNGALDPSSFTYQPGGSGDIIVVRALYEWPVTVSFLGLGNLSNGKRLLTATTTFRNEPFN